MRNVVLIHLESLNEIIYRMDKSCFPVLSEWEKKSIRFTNYFSTATSTLMVMSDLAYGDMKKFEPCDRLSSVVDKGKDKKSIFDSLSEKGYLVTALDYTVFQDVYKGNDNNFIGINTQLQHYENRSDFENAIENSMTLDVPFVLWVCDIQNNIDVNHKILSVNEELENVNAFDLRIEGYKHLDDNVDFVISCLEKKGILDDTSIIFYGDHGDDLFMHGWHGGLSHAIEPYSTLIKTPFWIYDSRFESTDLNDLQDTTDIAVIINCLLELPEKKLNIKELKIRNRQYTFARNMYAAQMLRKDTFNKAYSVTNGKFLLQVSNYGLELFNLFLDKVCSHNLLDYFEYENETLDFNNEIYGIPGKHFGGVYGEKELEFIKGVFYELITELKKMVATFHEYAERTEYMNVIDFAHIKYGSDAVKRRQSTQSTEFDFQRDFFRNKRVVLYGAGDEGSRWYRSLEKYIDIVAWVDQKYDSIGELFGRRIESPEIIKKGDYDCVVITIINTSIRRQVKDMLNSWGVDSAKIY